MLLTSSLGSIFDFLSIILNIEAVAILALLESGTRELDWEIPTDAIVKAKKTCKTFQEENVTFPYLMLDKCQKVVSTKKTSEIDALPASTSLAPA